MRCRSSASGIGLAWPRDDTLVVQESVSRSTGGYAGLFDPNSGLVEVAYYADDGVVLHEAAHGWFNGSLLADRWSNEAFASYYGEVGGQGAQGQGDDERADRRAQEVGHPAQRLGTGRPRGRGHRGLRLRRVPGRRAGDRRAGRCGWAPRGLAGRGRSGRGVPAADRESATTTTTAEPELVAGPPDWRVLLDLLEARTPASYDDLWRTWIARDEDLPILDDRAAARTEYEAIVAKAVDWELPRPIRDAMRAWRFDEADDAARRRVGGPRPTRRDQGRGRRCRARGAGHPARHVPGHGRVRRCHR